MKKIRKIILALVLSVSLLMPVAVAHAQVQEANYISIDAVHVFRNCLELNDQLYIIKYDINYTAVPTLPVSSTYLVRLRNGGVELGSVVPYPYYNSGYGTGYASIYFDAGTAPAWLGAYTIDLAGNPTLHWLAETATVNMTGAVSDNATGFTDETTESNSAAANDMTLMGFAPQVDDAYYFGSDGMFDILTLNLGTQGSWTGTGQWEYWNGYEWKEPDNVVDGTSDFEAVVGLHDLTFDCPVDWQASDVDGITAYWIRYRIVTYTATVQRPIGTQSWVNTMDPPIESTSTFSSWNDDGTIAGTQASLANFIRNAATELEYIWGPTYDLISSIAGVLRLTNAGEEYFENAIIALRDMAPDLFADVLSGADFPEKQLGGSYYTEGDDSANLTYGVNWFAQTFTPQYSEQINGVWLKGYRLGTAGNVTVSIRATAGSLPAGADLVSGNYTVNAITTDTDGDWYQWTFTEDYQMTGGTEYALVVRATAGNINNYFAWMADSTGSYAGGQASNSTSSGAVWTAMTGTDFLFQTTLREGYAMTLRNRLAARLIGTPFDYTRLGLLFGLSRMWMTAIIWLIVSILVIYGATRGTKSYKLTPLIFMLMMVFGGMTGFLYLEVSITTALLSFIGGVYVTFYKTA